jgi:hypothetical protein
MRVNSSAARDFDNRSFIKTVDAGWASENSHLLYSDKETMKLSIRIDNSHSTRIQIVNPLKGKAGRKQMQNSSEILVIAILS